MKIRALILIAFLVGPANSIAQSPATEAKIIAIRDAYKKANEQIAEMEKAPEFSSIFVTELVVNKNNASYPAVGIYNSTVRIYYTYGDREKNPYPKQLLKIAVTARRSSRTEASEYLYSENGQLIFAFEIKEDVEIRAYFQANRLIKFQKGDRSISVNSSEARSAVTEFTAAAKGFKAIFISSLDI